MRLKIQSHTMANDRPVTLQDIADRAGVSRSTVSLALRKSPRIGAAVVSKVLQLATSMNYKPNPLIGVHMAQLRAGKTLKYQGELAFISHFSESELAQRARTTAAQEEDIYSYARLRAENLGFKLAFYFHELDALSDSRLDRILWTRNVVGLIVGPLALPVAKINLDWSRYAASSWSYNLDGPPLHRVTHDYYGSMFLILKELQRLGYKRIGFCTHEFEDVRTNHLSISAFLYYEHFIPRAQKLSYLATKSPTWDDESLMSWYRNKRPDAVICTNHGAYEVFKRNGVRIPEDLGFAVAMKGVANEQMSGLRYNNKAIGNSLVDTVISQINNNERGIPAEQKTVLVPGVWTQGTTLRSP
jgi:LacI family transcriptional regulator